VYLVWFLLFSVCGVQCVVSGGAFLSHCGTLQYTLLMAFIQPKRLCNPTTCHLLSYTTSNQLTSCTWHALSSFCVAGSHLLWNLYLYSKHPVLIYTQHTVSTLTVILQHTTMPEPVTPLKTAWSGICYCSSCTIWSIDSISLHNFMFTWHSFSDTRILLCTLIMVHVTLLITKYHKWNVSRLLTDACSET
jgi:hypothetical protein